ncbi:hypothetical protein QFC21_002571 [Naganishia friedmannii]|uniref:Uncharacterized protein n=1 Tax=Naganishia friedmannii TaxID=89922 RepID=A0ACC2VUN0_9TREE|nr:hypothetical protein QFC21_002571 [Naganishia friedmannii]
MAYIAGHTPAVLKGHAARTAEDCAAYLLRHIKPDNYILDIGCGPGTITLGFAKRVPEGRVVGIDISPELMAKDTQEAQEQGIGNVTYQVGDIFHLPFSDATFDITHCHQVLCHLTDPKAAMKEMIRVTQPGGIVAAREAIFESMMIYPSTPALDAWKNKLQQMHLAKGQHPDAGKTLHHWALQLGIKPERIRSSAGNFCYSGREQREWWGSVWEERSISKEGEDSMVGPGIATKEEHSEISQEWKRWQGKEEAWFGMMHGEVLVWV